MKKLFLVALLFLSTVFSYGETFLTAKLLGGYNSWILGSAALSSLDSKPENINAGGFAFDIGMFLGNPSGVQYGLGFAYLPMFQASVEGNKAYLDLFPVTVDVLFNMGIFNFDVGLGFALLNASAVTEVGTFQDFAPSPGFIGKIGLGFNFKINDNIGFDVALSSILPFSDFGLSRGRSNLFLNMILFWQAEIFAGLSVSIPLF